MKSKFVFLLLCVTFVSACSGRLPQAELTYTGKLTAADRESILHRGNAASPAARLKIRREEEQATRKALEFLELQTQVDAPLVDAGFFTKGKDGYAVYRNGAAFYFNANGKMEVLDTISERIDRVILAGPRLRHIVGLSANGTQASWNADNLSQQLVIRPQNSTFGRKRVYDAVRTNGSAYLATASEGSHLELWSLTSGSLIRQYHLKDGQPRRIAQGSTKSNIVFGTNSGEVRIWRGRNSSTLLFKHSGPILDLYFLPKRQYIISASKDGTVKIFNQKTRVLLKTVRFNKAVYQINIAPDESRLVIVPSIGLPRVVDLSNMKDRAMRVTIGKITSSVLFAPNPKYLIVKHGAKGLSMWNLDAATQRGEIRPKYAKTVLDFNLAKPNNLIVIQTDNNRIEYWSISGMKFMGTALISETNISRIDVSTDGNWLLVVLADGRLLRQKITPNQETPIRVR